jgi:hypothetical protein
MFLSTAGLIAVRRWMPLSELKENHEVGGMILGVIAHAYAVLLSFVVVIIWGQCNDVAALLAPGAGNTGSMYWLAQGVIRT